MANLTQYKPIVGETGYPTKIDNLIDDLQTISDNYDSTKAEVEAARDSAENSTVYGSLDARLEQMEVDINAAGGGGGGGPSFVAADAGKVSLVNDAGTDYLWGGSDAGSPASEGEILQRSAGTDTYDWTRSLFIEHHVEDYEAVAPAANLITLTVGTTKNVVTSSISAATQLTIDTTALENDTSASFIHILTSTTAWPGLSFNSVLNCKFSDQVLNYDFSLTDLNGTHFLTYFVTKTGGTVTTFVNLIGTNYSEVAAWEYT